MKTCSKCEIEHEATTDNFSPDRKSKDGLRSWCKACQRKVVQEYFKTVGGNLSCKYRHMNRRCSKQQSYIDKGIKNKFKSVEHFIKYVVEYMKVDPRGLVVHRVDNAGHYAPGNIRFLAKEVHDKIHAG